MDDHVWTIAISWMTMSGPLPYHGLPCLDHCHIMDDHVWTIAISWMTMLGSLPYHG
ncbi:hypothetical protein DPMN_133735 [Dreissena polymorpha]|uniref:Uncharacterized protein n=1 Tax=Dreissena polymorpha TaxID=45954 RepID=A0A9D4JF42_DREPO|nr:hypothetical protein DPMN_133735 [Dreissena polymorpha]